MSDFDNLPPDYSVGQSLVAEPALPTSSYDSPAEQSVAPAAVAGGGTARYAVPANDSVPVTTEGTPLPMVDPSLDHGAGFAPCPPGQASVGMQPWTHRDPSWSDDEASGKLVPNLPVCAPISSDMDNSQMGYQDQSPVQIKAIDMRQAGDWNANNDNKLSGFSNPDELVNGALASAGKSQIADLQIIDHGGPGYQQMGDFNATPSENDMDNDPKLREQYLATMGQLKGHFAPNGTVELRGCHVGKGDLGTRYLQDNAQAMGVPVSAAHYYQYPGTPGTDPSVAPFQGPFTTCYPSAAAGVDPSCVVTDPRLQMSYAPGTNPTGVDDASKQTCYQNPLEQSPVAAEQVDAHSLDKDPLGH